VLVEEFIPLLFRHDVEELSLPRTTPRVRADHVPVIGHSRQAGKPYPVTRIWVICQDHPSAAAFDTRRLGSGDDLLDWITSPVALVVEVSPDGVTFVTHRLIHQPLIHAPNAVRPADRKQGQTAADHGRGHPEPPTLPDSLHRMLPAAELVRAMPFRHSCTG